MEPPRESLKLPDMPMNVFMEQELISTRDRKYITSLYEKMLSEGFDAPAELLRMRHDVLERKLATHENYNFQELGDVMHLWKAINAKRQTSRSRSPRRRDRANTWAVQPTTKQAQERQKCDRSSDKPKLWAAVERNDKTAVQELLEQGEDTEQKFRGWTPCMKAAEENAVEILQMLLDKKANMEECNRKGRTPLSFAAAPSRCGKTRRATSVAALKLLLENGANANHRDCRGMTAHNRAQREKRYEAVKILGKFHRSNDHRRTQS